MNPPGSELSNVITWVRRIIKSPSDAQITDATIQEYINRFYIYDAPARVQLFDLKRQYTFETLPYVQKYMFPYTEYQLGQPPVYCDGVQIGYTESNREFFNYCPEFVSNQQPFLGNGTPGPYTTVFGSDQLINTPPLNSTRPILRGFTDAMGNFEPFVFINAVDDAGIMHYIVDDGNGILNETDKEFQVVTTSAGVVDYVLGTATFTFAEPIPATNIITTLTSPFAPGIPRMMLFFNNIMTMYPVPRRPHKIQLDAYVTPAQFLNTSDFIPFTYMSEYLAVGAARKILRDNADTDLFDFYSAQLREIECQVLRRSERQRSTQRTPTIFAPASGSGHWNTFYSNY
jgi:hypothetical protein